MKIIGLGGAILLLLTAARAAFPKSFSFLPLGGSAISEVGIVFALSVAASTILDIARI